MDKHYNTGKIEAGNIAANNKTIDFCETFNKAFFIINSKMLKKRTVNYFERFLQDDRYHYLGRFTFQAIQPSHYKKAIEWLTALIRNAHRVKEVFLYRGIAQAMLQNNEEAEADFKTALEIDPRYAAAYHAMGALYLRNGLVYASQEWFQKAIEIDPDFHTAYFNLGKNYFELKYNSEAIKYFSKAIELYSNEPLFYYYRGLAFCKLNIFLKGFDDFTTAILNNPFFADAYLKRGKAKLQLGWGMDSMEDNLKCNLLKEKPSYAWMFLGEEYFKKDNYKEAKKAYNRYRNTGEELSGCYCNLGDCCFMLGQYGLAFSFYNKAIEVSRNFPWAWFNKGVICFLQKQYGEASIAFIMYVLLEPNDPDGYLNLSACYYMQGEYDLTIANCNHVLILDKNESQAYNNLALVFYRKGNISEAIEMMIKAIGLNEKADYYYNRAFYYSLNNNEELMNLDLVMWRKESGFHFDEPDFKDPKPYCARTSINHFNFIYEFIRSQIEDSAEERE